MALRPTADDVVVLDVDDTLYLERDYVRSGFDAVGAELEARLGVRGVGDTLWAGFLDGVRGDAFDQALCAHGLDPAPDVIATLVDRYRHHRPRIELAADADACLRRLTDRSGGRLAIITDGPEPSQRAKVEALGLSLLAEPIILTAALGPGRGKPHPGSYRRVEAAYGVAPACCWYIGDNPIKDFVTPVERGWTAVRIRRPGSLHEHLPTPPGVHEIATLDEIA